MDQMIDIIELIKIFVLSVVQGITEWLPISSTGHMIILEDLIPLNLSSEFVEVFLVLVQLGSIFAVILLYFNKLNPFSSKKSMKEKRSTMEIWFKVIVGVIPAGVLGVLFDDWLDEHFYNYLVVSIMLIIYGVLFIIIENRNKLLRIRCK